MKVDPKEVVLKDGRKLILRSPEVHEAQTVFDLIYKTAGETHFLANYPEEFKERMTLEKEKEWIQAKIDSPVSFYICAFDGDRAVGNSGLEAVAPKIKFRHRAGIGIGILKEYWGAGLGRMLLEMNMAQAKKIGYEILELDCFADNPRALNLYKSLGFQTIGIRPKAFKLQDNTYRDEVLMYKFMD